MKLQETRKPSYSSYLRKWNFRKPLGTVALIELFQPSVDRGRSFQGMKVPPLHDNK